MIKRGFVASVAGIGLLAGSMIGCETTKSQRMGMGGAAMGAGIGALADDSAEGAIAGAAIGFGLGYLLGELTDDGRGDYRDYGQDNYRHERRPVRRISMQQEFLKLMRIGDMRTTEREVMELGDTIGDRNGVLDRRERDFVLSQLNNEMLGMIDNHHGNGDGYVNQWEMNEFMNRYGNRPIVKILNQYQGY